MTETEENKTMLHGVRVAQAAIHAGPPGIRVYHELLLRLLSEARADIPAHSKEQRDLRDAIDWITHR